MILIGFADNHGTQAGNKQISVDRAITVLRRLSTQFPNGLVQMTPAGFGDAIPIRSNETEEGRSINRRVEVWLSNN